MSTHILRQAQDDRVKNKKCYRFILVLFLVSFFVRALFFETFLHTNRGYFVCSDSAQYHDMAVQIAGGNGIAKQDGQPTFYRVPGYSAFLALGYKLFGFDVVKTVWLQIFVSSFIPVLVFFLSLVFFPTNILLAQLSSIFTAFSLSFVLAAGLLMSDSLFVIFFLLFSILFFSSFSLLFCNGKKRLSFLKFFSAGLFLGAASLVRPVGHLLLLVSVLLILFSNFSLSEKFKSDSVLFLGWLLVVSGWLLRNFLLTGAIFFHTMPGHHFLTYFAAEVDSQANKITHHESKNKLLKERDKRVAVFQKSSGKRATELDICNISQTLAIEYLKSNPVITLKHAVVNIVKTLFSLNSSYLLFIDSYSLPYYDGTTSLWKKITRFLFPKTKNKLLVFVIYLEMLFLAFMLLGSFADLIFSLFNKGLFCEVCKILPLVGLLILLTFGSGVARLRLPVEPFLIIFATHFFLNMFKRVRSA